MLRVIRESWAWTGAEPVRIERTNQFGNVIFRTSDGAFWRICPEELECEMIASSEDEYRGLWEDEEFQLDWQMQRLVDLAREIHGDLPDDRCYCLKVPAVLGGEYERDNLATISRVELLQFSGDAARQVSDVPDGGQVYFEWGE